jgi:exodeoxyribonuclease V alpha subunit
MAIRDRQIGLFSSSPDHEAELTGTVARITFRSEETGYTVLRVSPEGEEKTVAVVGRMPPLAVGERVRAQGRWVEHPKFGRQLEALRLERRAPRTEEAIVRYLGSGLAAGIGPKLAERIVERFGESTLDVIDSRPEELSRVQGISPKKARALAEAVRENARLRDLTLLLEETGLGARYAARIHEKYGESALTVVREDPYRLARDIWGIGFVRADALARGLGVEAEDPGRVEAGVVHTLRRSADLGDVYLPAEDLVRAAQDLLGVDTIVVEQGVRDVVEGGRAVREDDRIYTPGLHRAESGSAERLSELLAERADDLPFEIHELHRLQRERAVELSPDQIEAVRLAHERHVLVITGGPGTGKTTLTRFLLDLFERHGLRLALAAPTGRAARRLSEATGRDASTLHRLLAFDPSAADFGRDESNPVEADVILVDEASMVDQRLFAHLLRAVADGSRLVLVGDADQLPSVGPGEVLRDLIRSGSVPTARLTRIFRQGERSGIVANAHRILAGDWPETCAPGEGDFVFVEREGPGEIAAEIRRLVAKVLPEEEGVDAVRDVQVLVPMYKGDAGADALNRALQHDLNARGREVKLGARTFREGDRVIQLRNDYARNVFNGEIGLVESIADEGRSLAVRFDSTVELPASDWDQVSLAYAITIHKSQGSEYDWVVVPLSTQHAILLERPLFYTAVTRARKGVILVGSRRALGLALRTGRSRGRRTTLAARLRGDLPPS